MLISQRLTLPELGKINNTTPMQASYRIPTSRSHLTPSPSDQSLIRNPQQKRTLQKAYTSIVSHLAFPPTERALEAMVSDRKLTVQETPHWIAFTPKFHPKTGLIVYPGAHVSAKAYAAVARQIAERGYQVVIVKMPLDFPMLAPDKAKRVLKDFPEIQKWGIAGHSLGGLSAASFARKHPDAIGALLCYASFPVVDLSKSPVTTKVILGSEDGLMGMWSFFDYNSRLPEHAEVVVIDGANHANFADYGDQLGDHKAQISRDEQQQAIVQETVQLLRKLKR